MVILCVPPGIAANVPEVKWANLGMNKVELVKGIAMDSIADPSIA